MATTLWIDADACPGAARDIIIRAALRHRLQTIFVANKSLVIPSAENFSFILVEQGPDVVDRYIIEHARADDMVITQDIPLAAELVPNGIIVISPHGTLFDQNNIGERLGIRNMATELRDSGLITGGPKPFGEKEKRQFANTFDQSLTRLLKSSR
jgi:uncharacterized protein